MAGLVKTPTLGRVRAKPIVVSSFLVTAILLSACAPAPAAAPTAAPVKPTAAAPAPPTAAPQAAAPAAAAPAAPQADPGKPPGWDQIVADAKREKLIVVTTLGDNDKEVLARFSKAYPDIPVEHTGARPSDISPKIISEQRNGVFSWDVMYSNGTSNMHEVLMGADAFQDLKPYLLLPEVLDDSKWNGGKALMFTSEQKPQILIHELFRTSALYVNREKIPVSELSDPKQLGDPKFKGKFVIDDCRVAAGGTSTLIGIWQYGGESLVRTILRDQAPAFSETKRITAEWIATGRYPIGIGVDEQELANLKKEGVGEAVQKLEYDGGNTSANGIAVFQNAPHPNAAKVFVNWFLSREGQIAWSEAWSRPIDRNSRRNDVPLRNAGAYPDHTKLDQIAIWGTDSGTKIVKAVTDACKENYP
jgi:iron(III) transport system substrate-binding protein